MTEILKASAGSGKTFQLAKKYIDLLLADRSGEAYKHILAITFTNKATAEMKSRILKELSILADDPLKSNYYEDLSKSHNMAAPELKQLAKLYRNNILHDYSSFAISTIDKFFQQTLRAFAKEVGYFNSYQVELDRDSLMGEAVDRILDAVSKENDEVLSWIDEVMKDEISRGDRFKVEGKMTSTARKMLSCDAPASAFSKDTLRKIRSACNDIIADFESRVKEEAQKWLLQATGVRLTSALEKYAGWKPQGKAIEPPKTTILKAVDPTHLKFLFESRYKIYKTAFIVRSLTYELGFVNEYEEALQALMAERNVISLEDSNSILRRIIDGSDAPFIYEKMGVRYTHFLLDEFQDTSRVQWENLRPLLRESDSRGGRNLVVGDVKQSIYRFRNSDWKLLDQDVSAQLQSAVVLPSQKENYRSCAEIVKFNSAFFEFASSELTGLFGKIEGTAPDTIYADAGQEAKFKDSQPGYVHVSFLTVEGDSRSKEPEIQAVMQAVYASVFDELSRGARQSDIAVLVRKNDQGERIANHLKANGIDVVSDDSLSLKSSTVVNALTAKMASMLREDDPVSAYLLGGFDIPAPQNYTSLPDLAEALLRGIKASIPEIFDSEILFIDGFMDFLLDWSSRNGNDLKSFLEFWDEKAPQSSSPEGVDAVKIMTIHKAKGLEFKHVIFPFADSSSFVPQKSWGWSAVDEYPSADVEVLRSAIYPVSFNKDTENTLFEKSWKKEQGLNAIDTLNLFYVALTRAVNSLHIISKMPSAECVDAVKQRNAGADCKYEFKDPAEMLYRFVEGESDWKAGIPYRYSSPEKEETPVSIGYDSVPIGDRLTPSSDAAEYFGEDGTTGVDASPRLAGIELHDILSKIDVLEDLDIYQGRDEYDMLRERVAAHPDWFAPGLKSMNERTIIDSDGVNCRPDRVLVNGSAVTVIDYKFGERRLKYEEQVRKYTDLFETLGYSPVEGYLWYVYEDEVVKV